MTRSCYTPMRCPSFFPIAGDCDTVNHDLKITGGDLAEGNDLFSAILIQLHSNRRDGDEGGFWGDEFVGFPLGSRLWTLSGNTGSGLAVKADEMIREALDIFIQQGRADEILVRTVDTINGLELRVDVLKEGRSLFSGVL